MEEGVEQDVVKEKEMPFEKEKGNDMVKKRGSKRCENCEGCSRKNDCMECKECRDKKKNGGPGILKMCCRFKKCQRSRKKPEYLHNLEPLLSRAPSSVHGPAVAAPITAPGPAVAALTTAPGPAVAAPTTAHGPTKPALSPLPTVPDIPADCPPPKKRIKRARLVHSPPEELKRSSRRRPA